MSRRIAEAGPRARPSTSSSPRSPGLLAAVRGRLARLREAREGATAVEFALVALPFFSMMFGALELGMIFLCSTTLDNATEIAARQVMTGQLQNSGTASASSFASLVCNNMGWLQSQCPGALSVNVQTYNSFNGVVPGQPAAPQFNMGQQCDIVLVQTFYDWALIVPGLDQALINHNGKVRVASSSTFRNQPYGTGATACP